MAALSSPAIAFLAVLGVAGALPTHPSASQGLLPDDRLHQAAVDALAPGKLLVAARRLPDPNFGNAVILLADFNGDGAVGLVVNRRSDDHGRAGVPAPDTDAGERRPGVPRRARRQDPGDGAAARGSVSGRGATRLRWHLPADAARGSRVRRHVQRGPGHLRVYLGYAGWGPGQLEAETAEGVWHVLAGDADAVFDPDPSSTWQRQIARTEVISAE